MDPNSCNKCLEDILLGDGVNLVACFRTANLKLNSITNIESLKYVSFITGRIFWFRFLLTDFESISTFADQISSSLSGSRKGGSTLHIKGSGYDPSSLALVGVGFSTQKAKNTVTADGVACNIISATSKSIKCDLQTKTTQSAMISTNATSQTSGYIKGTGFDYARSRYLPLILP